MNEFTSCIPQQFHLPTCTHLIAPWDLWIVSCSSSERYKLANWSVLKAMTKYQYSSTLSIRKHEVGRGWSAFLTLGEMETWLHGLSPPFIVPYHQTLTLWDGAIWKEPQFLKMSADWLVMLISHSLALEMSPGTFRVEMYLHVCSALRTRKSVSESWDQESDIQVHVMHLPLPTYSYFMSAFLTWLC